MRPIPGMVIIKTDSPYVTVSPGGIIIPGDMDREKWATAKCQCIGGKLDGKTVMVSYHVFFDYKHVAGRLVYNNTAIINGEAVWITPEVNILATWEGDRWQAYGEWVLMRPIIGDAEGSAEMEALGLMVSDMCRNVEVKGRGMHYNGMPDVPVGVELVFNNDYRVEYEIGREKFIVLKQDRIEAYLPAGTSGTVEKRKEVAFSDTQQLFKEFGVNKN